MINSKAPAWVIKKALAILVKYQRNEIKAMHSAGKGYLTININPKWRLFSKDSGNNWDVVSINKYKIIIDK